MNLGPVKNRHTVHLQRRRLLRAGLGMAALGSGCAGGTARRHAWEDRLRGDTWALLGEVHDHAAHHRERLAVLQRALAAGWRPALAMEQFDLDRQADIERSRREKPRDADHLIAQAAAGRGGWDWPQYRPLVDLALQWDLPLLAANLPRTQAMRLVRETFDGVLGAARSGELGLSAPLDAALQAAHEREVDAAHCGALPPGMRPGMARAQVARDAVMARVLMQEAQRGAVLIAGNGHVRRDIGVPRWLNPSTAARVLSVGFVETGNELAPGQFDAVVIAAPARREDPCTGLAERLRRPR